MLPETLIATWNIQHHPFSLSETLSPFSGKKLWWKCEENHEWEAVIADRTKGQGCPYCAGKRVLQGFNDLATTHPHLMHFWHPTKNLLNPTEVSKGSRQSAWWTCKNEHEWEESIKKISGGRGCPYCAGKRVLSGSNDLVSTHPELAKEWHPTLNTEILASEINYGSTVPVWWKCIQGHSWKTSPNRRKGCAICAGKQVLAGFNDLASTHTLLSQEWHPTKNDLCTPSQVTCGSSKKAWWQCEQGHEWEARLGDRTRQDKSTGCPTCATSGPSRSEIAVGDWVQSLGITVVRNSKMIIPSYELDLYLPDSKFAIEFNGLYWHSEANGRGKHYHSNKVAACKQKGITLFQIWEDDWNNKPEIIKQMILHRLGLSTQKTIFARTATVQILQTAQAHDFLNQYHIQGKANGGLYLGLVEKSSEKIVAVMVFKSMPGNIIYLERYATSCRVPGGFTRLLKHAIKILNPTKIITFADQSISEGNLYEKNGFVVDGYLKPDYSYLVRGQRVHKFNYRLKRFRDDPALQYEDGLSESKLAQLNKLYRIWDSGKIRYVLTP